MNKSKNKWGIWHYIKSYKFNSIFIKNFLLIVLTTALPIVLISASIYNYYNGNLKDEINTTNTNGLSKIKNMVDLTALESDRLSLRLASDSDIKFLLSYSNLNFMDFNTYQTFTNLQRMMGIITTTNDFIDSVFIYFEKSDFVLATDGYSMDFLHFPDQQWKEEYLNLKKTSNYWVSPRNAIKPFQVRTQIHLSSFRTISNNNEDGVVIVNIDVEKLNDIIENVNDKKQHNLFILNNEGKILYNTDLTKVGKNIRDFEKFKGYSTIETGSSISEDSQGVKQVVSVQESEYNNWKYIYITPTIQYSERTKDFEIFMLVSVIVSILITIISAFFIFVRVFQPIKNMVSLIERPSEWEGLIKIDDEKHFNEFKYVAKTILKSFVKTRQMEAAMTERMDLLRKAQSVALQAQINPHFLYNTLETINWKVMGMAGGDNEVSDMIASLSELLRLSLETENSLVTINTEIEHAKLYLHIQNMRYKEKFQVIWNIDEHILNNKIIKLTIQPILENAIYHGIKPKKGKGKIIIKGTTIENQIVIEIIDNGLGMNEDEVEVLNMNMKDSYIKEDIHIGMKNVNQRIKLFFGDEFGLTISSEYKRFTLVRICIPIVE